MNQLIIPEENFDHHSNIAWTNSKAAIDHLKNIVKASDGDKINIAILNKGIGQGILKYTKEKIIVTIDNLEKGDEPWSRLFIGLSRPPTCKRIIEHGTTMGVSEFVFFRSQLSEKSYATSKIWEDDSLEKILYLGLSQSKKYYQLPKVSLCNSTHELPIPKHNKYLLSLNSEHWMNHRTNITDNEIINFAIGSERGLVESEECFFKEKDFIPIKISQATVRVEHAVIACLSQAELLLNSKK